MARQWLLKARNSPDERIATAALKGLNAEETQISGAEVILGLAILAAVLGGNDSSNSSNDTDTNDILYEAQRREYRRSQERYHREINSAFDWIIN